MTDFGSEFVWGASSSAYQIEGAAGIGGRGPSVWDVHCRKPGAIRHGEHGGDACDHYHRFREDVGLMRDIGLKAYRLSVSWSRVLPEGTGAINEEGLSFYDALVDELLGAGIEPWITLYHFDLPDALFRRGGWLNREIAGWFAEYAEVLTDRLSDRVSKWMTFNEPQCFAYMGYDNGREGHGPGLTMHDRLEAVYSVQLAHGAGVRAIRSRAKLKPWIGYVPVAVTMTPATDSAEDIAAARAETNRCREGDLWNGMWFTDPVVLGRYPEDGLRAYAEHLPRIVDRDLELMRAPLDYLGLNIYEGIRVRAGADGEVVRLGEEPGRQRTRMGWGVTPEVLRWGPRFYHERYQLPCCITENGMADNDWVSPDGRVHDPRRIDYLWRHLKALRQGMSEGADVRGYFTWSILDNFEWAQGYDMRFGLIHVDYQTKARTLKNSAHWYRKVIDTNGTLLDEPFRVDWGP